MGCQKVKSAQEIFLSSDIFVLICPVQKKILAMGRDFSQFLDGWSVGVLGKPPDERDLTWIRPKISSCLSLTSPLFPHSRITQATVEPCNSHQQSWWISSDLVSWGQRIKNGRLAGQAETARIMVDAFYRHGPRT